MCFYFHLEILGVFNVFFCFFRGQMGGQMGVRWGSDGGQMEVRWRSDGGVLLTISDSQTAQNFQTVFNASKNVLSTDTG